MTGFYPVEEIPDITKNNPVCIVYLCGNEFTDGSIRLIIDTSHGDPHMNVQSRDNGVWNYAGVDVEHLNISEALLLLRAGPYLMTQTASNDKTYLHSRTQFNDASGTAEAAEVPAWGALVTRSIQQVDNSGEISGNSVSWTELVSNIRVVTRLYIDVTSAATDNATLTIVNGGVQFTRRIGASELTLGEQFIDLPGFVNEDDLGETLTYTFTVDNGGTMAIAADVSNTIAWFAYSYYPEEHRISAPMDVMADSFIFDNISHQMITTSDGNAIITKPSIEV